MISNGIVCSRWRLYVIVDPLACRNVSVLDVARAAIDGGADVIQLRDKRGSARQILDVAEPIVRLTRAARIPFIINDRVDLMRAVGADGVHLGQEDLPVPLARAMPQPSSFLIGQSTHSVEQAVAAQAEGADYLGAGPIFPTPTKPDYGHVGTSLIQQVTTAVTRPIVCIGGIDSTNIHQVLAAGGRCIAVVRAVCAVDHPEAATRHLKTIIQQFVPTANISS